ncbi:hypothetical protein E2C01_005330 [Portunus trituberculatus]|uniref:Uncharacterized protein n=1 Tax=Portunus trituberculatus TaxID=210409 RepID=A0A5B7CWD7_PORTR|nr:hypothetical protein [Portunus trituberculatus]
MTVTFHLWEVQCFMSVQRGPVGYSYSLAVLFLLSLFLLSLGCFQVFRGQHHDDPCFPWGCSYLSTLIPSYLAMAWNQPQHTSQQHHPNCPSHSDHITRCFLHFPLLHSPHTSPSYSV